MSQEDNNSIIKAGMVIEVLGTPPIFIALSIYAQNLMPISYCLTE
ncbi:MAG: hypothetical protein ACJA0N_001202 [Pseudohongiellaceae bacterium]|jgi:hypothetical protein